MAKPIRVGFYVPWDENSAASLVDHGDQLDWLVAGLISVTGQRHQIHIAPDERLKAILAGAKHPAALFAMVQNAVEEDWDGEGAAALLATATARADLLDRIASPLVALKAAGVVFDFEQLPPASLPDYLRLIGEAKARLAGRNLQIVVMAPSDSSDWRLKAFATVADKVIVKVFDEHSPDTGPGPIASQRWAAAQVTRAMAAVVADKLILAVGNFAYDWPANGDATRISVEEAWLIARDSQAPIRFDPATGNPMVAYDEDDQPHTLWLLDAATAWNHVRLAYASGAAGIGIWRLGTEDSGLWPILRSLDRATPPDIASLRSTSNIDVEGRGEIMHIAAVPTNGRRALTVDRDGAITDERYLRLPTPYLIRRTGDHPHDIVLTFDDGPDPVWTPQVLKILREKNAPAAFFVVGENALGQRDLLNQIVDQGHELGNHSFSHPNLATVSPTQAQLELNVTQRLVQAYTGRSMRLFRAPYFGDAEASTAGELDAALMAQENGYTNVGLHVDPQDWRSRTAAAIVKSVIAQVEDRSNSDTRQIILLHDGGGDRHQTILALPRIIDELRARGYQFVSVARLAKLSRADTMPPVPSGELTAVRADTGLFMLLSALGRLMTGIFYIAILVGLARAITMTALAFLQYDRSRHRVRPAIDPSLLVSVIIPAFNEERGIEAAIRQVLANRDAHIEVIVVDDGSSDATAAIVRTVFGDNPVVRLISLPNGGKAKALNHAIGVARGEVLIAHDADTLFGPETIARLARWFADPRIGAVAGNVKVANRVNLITRWQAIEYVTSQNLERRALAAVKSITVVPGAVGAFRRAALAQGYPEDTLAEDQDLTIRIQRDGWKVIYDPSAMAWTEVPEGIALLARQRFRWAFGTLQCLWKHRSILWTFKPVGLALFGIPQALIFQIGFALIAPLIDLFLVLNVTAAVIHWLQHGTGDVQAADLTMIFYWLGFATIDALCGYAAYAMEPRREKCPVLLLVAQRLVYRQLMYWAVIRAIMAALRGPSVRWGKPNRSGWLGRRSRNPFFRRRQRTTAHNVGQ
ncbi:glycosyltransferase [Sphingomonas sp. 28-63-12]|uniref:glycosyltransferase n=1 Tax=Sphingomonas sp. 28-63-12 TaxID=1970434 RepID=UPI0035A8B878